MSSRRVAGRVGWAAGPEPADLALAAARRPAARLSRCRRSSTRAAPVSIRPGSRPRWLGPPDNVLGGLVALGLTAARSENAAVRVELATAYPTGVQFRIDVRWRAEVKSISMSAAWDQERGPGQALPTDLFRAGFQLADGS